MVPNFLLNRAFLYDKVIGSGLEIGAFEHPAKLPSSCDVTYCDVINKEVASRLFPEINLDSVPEVDVLLDIDKDGLDSFKDNSQDFVIINHVLEHLFDPVNAICECVRVLRKNGMLILSIPDKRFTFDKDRPLTESNHIFQRINRVPKSPLPRDYEDMLRYVHPELLKQSVEAQNFALESFLSRR